MAIETVAALVLMVVAIVLLWLFISGGTAVIVQNIQKITNQIICVVKQRFLGLLSPLAFC